MTRLVVILGFLVAFSAGVIVGFEARARKAMAPTTRPGSPRGMLAAELGLTADQQAKMDKIWSETAGHGGHEQEDRRRKIRQQRDESIAELIGAENKVKYDQIQKTYSDEMAAMDKEWRSAFENAVMRTNEILTPDQQAKYKQWLSRHQWDRRRDGNRGEFGRRGEDRATRPASQP